MYEKLNFGGFVVKAAESQLPGSAVYYTRLWQQKKRNCSFKQVPSFFADGIFIFAVYFDTYVLLRRK